MLRKIIFVTSGLILMSGFFVGLTLAVRANNSIHLILGVGLMVTTPVIHNWLSPVFLRDEPLKTRHFWSSLKYMLPRLGPIILGLTLIVFSMTAVRKFGYFGEIAPLLFLAPTVSILIDAIQGKRRWDVTELSSASVNLTLFTLVVLVCGLSVVGVGFLVYVVGIVSLLISVGDLIYQWFAEASPIRPYLCKYIVTQTTHLPCSLLLVIWHSTTVFLMWWLVGQHESILGKVTGVLRAYYQYLKK